MSLMQIQETAVAAKKYTNKETAIEQMKEWRFVKESDWKDVKAAFKLRKKFRVNPASNLPKCISNDTKSYGMIPSSKWVEVLVGSYRYSREEAIRLCDKYTGKELCLRLRLNPHKELRPNSFYSYLCAEIRNELEKNHEVSSDEEEHVVTTPQLAGDRDVQYYMTFQQQRDSIKRLTAAPGKAPLMLQDQTSVRSSTGAASSNTAPTDSISTPPRTSTMSDLEARLREADEPDNDPIIDPKKLNNLKKRNRGKTAPPADGTLNAEDDVNPPDPKKTKMGLKTSKTNK